MVRIKIILGSLGFIPFGLFTTLPWILGEHIAEFSLSLLAIYGGVILSFLGGMIWGWSNEFLNKKALLLGVLFSLTGFVIIFLVQRYLLFALILNFIFFPLFYLLAYRSQPSHQIRTPSPQSAYRKEAAAIY